MSYKNLAACVADLEKAGHLVRIKEEVDPYLEMAAIHLRVFENEGPAIFFEKVKGSKFPALSNLFGDMERSRFLFRDTWEDVRKLIRLKYHPREILKHPGLALRARYSVPKRISSHPSLYKEIKLSDLPQLQCWKDDGGAFITLPQVYTEDPENPGVNASNLGMYRIQLSGNDYIPNQEAGLHYQIHRGIGVHQAKANASGKPFKVSIFVGGPPAHTLAAVMPLPEGLSELTFAGAIGGRRFRYGYHEGYCISSDTDFVITGEVVGNATKPEGPFGDHLGYYSLKHEFPVMRIHKVWHRKDAIWPFTVVGRPPQEDTAFGKLIHELTGDVLPMEIPGLKQVHAVDAAGVHPLLLAVGSERYTPYLKERRPQEILTIANHILGSGQMSLAKFLFIAAGEDNPKLEAQDIPSFFKHILERADWSRDLHFHTNTTIDTLDYSGAGLNSGSKVVIAAAGEKKRELGTEIPELGLPHGFSDPKLALPGILILQAPPFQLSTINYQLSTIPSSFPLVVLADDSAFAAKTLGNFLWTTFTKSNPSHDIHGIDEFTENKHWGCRGPLIIDARSKPHHAPPLLKDPEVEKRVDALGAKGKSLHGII